MAKNKVAGSNPTDGTNKAIQIVDKSIQIVTIDRTTKGLADWKNALVSAESIIQPTRRLLYDLYASVVLDDQLISVMGKRRRAISRASITFQIDGEEVEAMSVVVEKRWFKKLLTLIIDARLYGYSLIQVDATNASVELVHRAHVIPSKTLVVTTPYDTLGIDYSQSPYDRYYLGVGDADDLGLLFPAAYCVLLKRNDVTDWATFNELYGQPFRIGKYDPMDPGQKQQLEKGLDAMGRAAYAVIPIGAEVELAEVNKTGAKDTYEAFAARMDKAISKIMIGQTMTTDDGSSKSQAEVHERVADEIVMDDLDYVLSYLNEHLKPMLLAQGLPVGTGKFVVIEEEAKLSKKDRLAMDIDIHQKVAPLDLDYFATEYNVPIDAEALAKRQEQADALPNQPPADSGKQDSGKRDKKAPTKGPDSGSPDREKPDKAKLAAAHSPDEAWSFLELLKDFFVNAPTR